MDLYQAIKDLQAEKKRLDQVIESLESLLADGKPQKAKPDPPPPRLRGRRGRKHMNEDERIQVSERMRRYWASRRKTQGFAGKAEAETAGSD